MAAFTSGKLRPNCIGVKQVFGGHKAFAIVQAAGVPSE